MELCKNVQPIIHTSKAEGHRAYTHKKVRRRLQPPILFRKNEQRNNGGRSINLSMASHW